MKPRTWKGDLRALKRGFTLIELLVVVAVIGILAGILLPTLSQAKKKALRTGCISNLKQIGLALREYADEHEDWLPGPVWGTARASYDNTSSEELIFYIAEYLGEYRPSPKINVAEVFVCPGFRRYAPALTSLVGRKCYKLSGDLDPNPATKVLPFGYPGSQPQPLKVSELTQYGPPDSLMAVTDLDKGNMPPSSSLYADLPYEPVHGRVRMELYFDGHVDAKQW